MVRLPTTVPRVNWEYKCVCVKHWLLWTDGIENSRLSGFSFATPMIYSIVRQTHAVSLPIHRGDPACVAIVSGGIVRALQDPVRQDRQM
jgi:hypothetical protein